MTYGAHLARHLEPDERPDHDPDGPCWCDDCTDIAADEHDERMADARRDER